MSDRALMITWPAIMRHSVAEYNVYERLLHFDMLPGPGLYSEYVRALCNMCPDIIHGSKGRTLGPPVDPVLISALAEAVTIQHYPMKLHWML